MAGPLRDDYQSTYLTKLGKQNSPTCANLYDRPMKRGHFLLLDHFLPEYTLDPGPCQVAKLTCRSKVQVVSMYAVQKATELTTILS